MDDTQADALRKPFAKEAIGKLPKPYKKDSPRSQCRECNGFHGMPAVHLDYVGHAATTDRLLQVDPLWSWEPMAYDMGGLPLFDGNRNLWIKLTVCGVTRIGVGDGTSLKECIGDAIRNAAMRFGVALDLWAKEDLWADSIERGTEPEAATTADPVAPQATRTMSRKRPAESKPAEMDTPRRGPAEPAPEPDDGWRPPDEAATPTVDPKAISPAQLKMLHAILTQKGLGDRDASLRTISKILERDVASSKDLSKADASVCIDALGAVA